jgi:hypothetical protein
MHYLCCYLTLRHSCDVCFGTVVPVLYRVLGWYAGDYFECFLSVMLAFFTRQEQSPSQPLAWTLCVLETPWKRKITVQHATGTPKCSQHDSVACFWRSCINLWITLVKQPPGISHPPFIKAPQEMVNTTIVTNQLNTLIRQHTLIILITFPLTDFCLGKVWCK